MTVLTVYPSKTPVDSYSESNYSTLQILYSGVAIFLGQSFINPTATKLTKCVLYIQKVGSPTGNVYAKLYYEKHTVAFGTDSIPDISKGLLATSDALDISTLTTSPQLITFNFTGAQQYQMPAGNYCIELNYDGGDITKYLAIGCDNTTPTASGNMSYSVDGTTWLTDATNDVCFYVYGNTVDGSVNRQSASVPLATLVAGAGTGANPTPDSIVCAYLNSTTVTDEYQEILRGIFLFDVTGFSGLSDNIALITLNLYVYNSLDDLAVTSFNVVGSSPANNNNLVAADYGQVGTTKFSEDIAIAGIGTGYKSITLNAAGIVAVKAAIAGDKIVKLGTRLTADGLGGGLTWGSSKTSYVGIYTVEKGTIYRPYLEITCTVPSGFFQLF